MENSTIYHTSSGGVILVVAGTIVMGLVSVLSFQQGRGDNWIPWTYVLLLLTISVDMKFGIYAQKRGEYFCETKHFFYRRCIKISTIAKIWYKPTWIIGENMRSVYLIDKDGGEIKIRMANGAYSASTLGRIVRELMEVNPSIELDTDARKLLQMSL